MDNRQNDIHNKGFDMSSNSRPQYEGPLDYGKIKVGTKVVDDAIIDLGSFKKVHRSYGNKFVVLKALAENNIPLLREISEFFYNTSGIYSRVCDYFAYLYRYDWYIAPEVFDETVKEEKILKDFNNLLNYLDESHLKKLCGDIAFEIIVKGAYYGLKIPCEDHLLLQQLPANYCRVRFYSGHIPMVELNMKYFDEQFRDIQYRMKVLKSFPKDVQKGYLLYKQGKLVADNPMDTCGSWYVLEVGSAIKFSITKNDRPLFINAIPAIIDLDLGQELDRKKQAQQLMKLVIQELPLDKNGDLLFDVEEARDIHNNAVDMLRHAIGTDVITTFAKLSVEDLTGSAASAAEGAENVKNLERAVYNQFGTSRNLFNSDTNLAMEKSILSDESSIRRMLLDFHIFFDDVVRDFYTGNKKKYKFKFFMLETTQYNYREMSKIYKEQAQLGFSKMLPEIALGHSQSFIIHSVYFETKVLHLNELMIPPMSSATMNADSLKELRGTGKGDGATTTGAKNIENEEKQTGRPEKSDDEKSEKTIANRESM